MVVLDAEGATREFTTSEGATNALADAQDMAPITAVDFIFGKLRVGRVYRRMCYLCCVVEKRRARDIEKDVAVPLCVPPMK